MRYLSLLFLSLFTVGLLCLPRLAQAHVLQTDGTIGAVLHINPNDEPVAQRQSTFLFEFKDTKNSFELANCQCSATILSNEKEIYTTDLSTTPAFSYTFPTAGVYTIQLAGTSLAQSFQPFRLSYTIRVEQGRGDTSEPSLLGTIVYHVIHYGIFVIGLIVLVILVIREKNKQKRDIQKGTNNL